MTTTGIPVVCTIPLLFPFDMGIGRNNNSSFIVTFLAANLSQTILILSSLFYDFSFNESMLRLLNHHRTIFMGNTGIPMIILIILILFSSFVFSRSNFPCRLIGTARAFSLHYSWFVGCRLLFYFIINDRMRLFF